MPPCLVFNLPINLLLIDTGARIIACLRLFLIREIIFGAAIHHSRFWGAFCDNMWKPLQTICTSMEGSASASGCPHLWGWLVPEPCCSGNISWQSRGSWIWSCGPYSSCRGNLPSPTLTCLNLQDLHPVWKALVCSPAWRDLVARVIKHSSTKDWSLAEWKMLIYLSTLCHRDTDEDMDLGWSGLQFK